MGDEFGLGDAKNSEFRAWELSGSQAWGVWINCFISCEHMYGDDDKLEMDAHEYGRWLYDWEFLLYLSACVCTYMCTCMCVELGEN